MKKLFMMTVGFLAVLLLQNQAFAGKKCFYISSYDPSYAWNAVLDLALKNTLAGKCEFKQFDLDTKRNPSPEHAKKVGEEAKKLLDTFKPDVVLLSDDNAQRIVAVPFLKGTKIPLVFTGVNWTADEYGYPWSNATGMLETKAIEPLLSEIQNIVTAQIKSATFLSSDTETERKDFERFKIVYSKKGIKISGVFVKTFAEWKSAFITAQKSDFIVLNNSAGISDWNEEQAKAIVTAQSKKMTVAIYDWMAPLAMLSMTTSAVEQGEYPAVVAIEILAGKKPSEFPVIPNRKWSIYVNTDIAEKAGLKIPDYLVEKAKKK